MDIQPRTIPIHKSLNRQNLVFGGERDLMLTVMLISFLVGVGGMTFVSAICAVIFFIIGVFVLRAMAKVDPMMSKVWRRSINHQEYYLAHTSRWRMKPGYKAKTKQL